MMHQPTLPFAPVRRSFAEPIVAAASNEPARTWLARTAHWPQRRLALWGPAASGKSRLLAHWAATHDAAEIDGPTLRFTLPTAPLAIDNADRADPLILLHTLNAAAEAGHPVLLAARTPPARWPVDLPDLASRLRATTAVAIGPPEDDLLARLLARLLAERQFRVPEPTQAWLLARLPRTHAAIAEAVARLEEAAAAITPALARATLAELLADMPDDDVFASPTPPASPAPAPLL